MKGERNFVAKNNFNRGGAHADKHKQIYRDKKYKDEDINEELTDLNNEIKNL